MYLGFLIGIIFTLLFSTDFADLISIRIAIGSGVAFITAQLLDIQTRTSVLNALMSLNYEMYVENYSVACTTYTGCYDISVHVIDEDSPKNNCGDEILSNVLNTPGLIRVTSQDHLGSYSDLISNIPGISNYFGRCNKFDHQTSDQPPSPLTRILSSQPMLLHRP